MEKKHKGKHFLENTTSYLELRENSLLTAELLKEISLSFDKCLGRVALTNLVESLRFLLY